MMFFFLLENSCFYIIDRLVSFFFRIVRGCLVLKRGVYRVVVYISLILNIGIDIVIIMYF